MTVLARLIEVVARVPQFLGVSSFDDLHHLETDVAQRFDLGVPEDRIFLELRGDLRR